MLHCETLRRKRREFTRKKGEKEKGERERVTRCISKGSIAFCSGQIPLWSKRVGPWGVAGIITGIMR